MTYRDRHQFYAVWFKISRLYLNVKQHFLRFPPRIDWLTSSLPCCNYQELNVAQLTSRRSMMSAERTARHLRRSEHFFKMQIWVFALLWCPTFTFRALVILAFRSMCDHKVKFSIFSHPSTMNCRESSVVVRRYLFYLFIWKLITLSICYNLNSCDK
jgi:hypothetical protein